MAKSEEKVNELMRAYARALRAVKRERLLKSTRSAGFIDDPNEPGSMKGKKGKRHGYQIAVSLVKYSDLKLAKCPNSGGLHAEF